MGGSLEKFDDASTLLFAAFVEGETGSNPRILANAFFLFHKKLLAEEHDKGIPQRVRLHPIPVIVAHA